jgi:competence protein ComEC
MKKAILLIVLMLILGCTPKHSIIPGKNMSVVFFDVGQGDSSLIVTADGKKILIDCGEFGDAAFYLRKMNITWIDVLIETHPDADHVKGCGAVKEVAEVGIVLTNKNVYDDFYLELTDTALLEVIVAYDSHGRFEGDNDNSVGLRATYGKVSFLFTGDCGWRCENELADTAKLKADVLKVGHHGSKYSSTLKFLEKVKPSAAVVSCGKRNSYGHPANETLKRLGNIGAKVYRTDLDGSVIATTDGKSYSVI